MPNWFLFTRFTRQLIKGRAINQQQSKSRPISSSGWEVEVIGHKITAEANSNPDKSEKSKEVKTDSDNNSFNEFLHISIYIKQSADSLLMHRCPHKRKFRVELKFLTN